MKVNSHLFASIIVSVYDDVDALALILDALEKQTHQNFEIVVSEDGQNEGIAKLIQSRANPKITHSHHADLGWRKNKILNQSVSLAQGDLLIFIDGDCIPHRRFIEAHCRLAQPKTVYSGRRVNIKQPLLQKVRSRSLNIDAFNSFVFAAFNLRSYIASLDQLANVFYIDPASWLGSKLLSKQLKRRILGSNFSCFKTDLLAINGFDEDYNFPAFGEDTDLEWRFDAIGINRRSARNVAIQFHLDHPIRYDKIEEKEAFMNKKKEMGHFFCFKGIVNPSNATQASRHGVN